MSYARVDSMHLKSLLDRIKADIKACNYTGGWALGSLIHVETELKQIYEHCMYEDDYTALDKEPSYV